MNTRQRLPVNSVVFDLDGTLIDTVPLIVASHQHTFRTHLGHELDPEQIKSYIGRPLEACFGDLKPGHVQEMLATYLEYNNKRTLTHVGIFLDIIPMLDRLKAAGFQMAIVTSKRFSNAKESLEGFGLFPYFDVVLAKDDTKRHKPHPDPLYKVAEVLGLDAVETMLYVGDSVHDLEAAHNAGCYSAIVDWTDMPKNDLRAAQPTIWVDYALDLPDMICHA